MTNSPSFLKRKADAISEVSDSDIVSIRVRSLASELPVIRLPVSAAISELADLVIGLDPSAYRDFRPIFVRSIADDESVELDDESRSLSSYGLQAGDDEVLMLVLEDVSNFSRKLERLKLDAVTQILRRGGRYVTSLEFRNFIRHDDDCPALVSALKSLTSLTYLSVGFDSFFKLMPDLKSVLTMENLKFKLSSDHARVARRCKELAVLLQDLLSCTHLDFTHQKIDDRGMPDLVPALASLHALTHLNLHDNNIGDYSCYTLSEALLQLTSLTHLDLGTNLISDSGCVFLCKSLSNMTSLTFLDLNWNLLLRSGSLLAHTFTNLTSLQHLAVSGMPGQYETEAPALISLLCTLRQLTHLDLNSNRLTVSSCRALAEVLPNFEKLQTLKLYVNEIDDAGCLALSSVLNRLPFLSVLDLSQNRIGDEGFRALASALSSMPTLTQFFVDRNQNTEDGCRAVAPVIASLTDVVSWDLGHGNRVHHTSCATCKQLAAVRVVTVPRPQSNYVEEDPIGW